MIMGVGHQGWDLPGNGFAPGTIQLVFERKTHAARAEHDCHGPWVHVIEILIGLFQRQVKGYLHKRQNVLRMHAGGIVA